MSIACAISKIDIQPGEEVVVFIIGRHLSRGTGEVKHDTRSGLEGYLFPNNLFKLLSPFHMTGKVEDYGQFEFDKTAQNDHTINVWAKVIGQSPEDALGLISDASGIPNFKYMFCGTDEWTYSCIPFAIRKDVFEYCMMRKKFDLEKTLAMGVKLQKSINSVAEKHFASYNKMGYYKQDEQELVASFLRSRILQDSTVYKKIDKEHRKTYKSLSPEKDAVIWLDHTGGEGEAFVYRDQSVDFIIQSYHAKMPSELFQSAFAQICQGHLLRIFVRSMNMVFLPNAYSTQTPKYDIIASVLNGFAQIASKQFQKEKDEFYSWDYNKKNKFKGALEDFGFTKE